ncbi:MULTISPECIES: aspartate ammonia-lyase [Pseudoalteromonas]|uniref:aspartate ammonia-lyase n=1 Tax=Pseudoalteromonas TaxID=53246 RepID=UPI000C337201|nr:MULTISPECIES: aspartate ammonia-lyase [Pseudoalteromonas]PKG63519.1 aspartate ammonia-lyase [Pseudoalteromonas arctica]PKG68574.1 aspartate ammonia-lyase [Pseudoalteromonas sp. GutCa3]PKG68701.1 aspartate ammonia-lyase [Pseudoalteromonas sp. GutCa3]
MLTRLESDLLGEMELPDEVWYGIQTQRARDNFSITGIPIGHFPELVDSLAMVKASAAHANKKLGLLSELKANAIIAACDDIRQGDYYHAFVVDSIQGGAGTSTNMNANEVIANIALTKLGYEKGNYKELHPNDDVNRCQSTNDVYPSAACLAIQLAGDNLIIAVEALKIGLEEKAEEFKDVIKMGRTQLQDAVPMSLGQEFGAYAVTLGEETSRLQEAGKLLCEINLGGTAIGTGINSHRGYSSLAISYLAKISNKPLVQASNLVEATSDMGAFVYYSGILKRLAVKLSKICNDLRLLSSGPRTGFGEISLPAVQPGSSIMPGKVNPVIPEAVNQTAYQVIASDLAVTLAAEAGQLQLNAMEPLIIYNILNSIKMLASNCDMLNKRCIKGIKANVSRCQEHVLNSIGTVTALVPLIGYGNASSVAAQALRENKTIHEIVLERGLMSEEALTAALDPRSMLAMS